MLTFSLQKSVGISVVCQGYAVMGVIAAVFILLVSQWVYLWCARESVGISVVCQVYAVMGVIAAVFILLVSLWVYLWCARESVGISVVCQGYAVMGVIAAVFILLVGYAVMGVVAAVFILLVVPETKNRTLEQISHDLETRSVCGRLNQWLACCRGGLSRRRHASVRIEDSVYSPIHREPMHL
ncbi:hypothetical protein Bbelb_229140 [Branchiostoma belcheri]|nr:hypothetical protein Bbelb_229140 [Branchiostoma belcheri]